MNKLDYNEELEIISIRGARENNLQNVDVDIPRDTFTVISGLSGSGKSSLAFDTLYAEGQRRYVDCMSPYSKQFLDILKKPDVDSIEGLSPAISIEQKSISRNPRSTVGTTTEIYDYLRLLFAKIGTQYALESGLPVIQKSQEQIIDEVKNDFDGISIQLLSPLVKGRKGHYRDLFEKLLKQGFTRVRVNGEIKPISPSMQLVRYKTHNIELVIDKIKILPKNDERIRQSIDLAINRGEGYMMVIADDEHHEPEEKEHLFSTLYTDPITGRAYEPLAPNCFSFNSPYGACPRCNGIGDVTDFDNELIIPDPNLTIRDGAIKPLGKDAHSWIWAQTKIFADRHRISLDSPIKDMPEDKLQLILYNEANNKQLQYNPKKSKKEREFDARSRGYQFEGILPELLHVMENANTANKRELEVYLEKKVCPVCKGGRLKLESLAVRILDYNIHAIVSLDIDECDAILEKMEKGITDRQRQIAGIIIHEIRNRLKFLLDVGLPYLSLSRSVRTLSGGESQRIRLASQIGSQLVGIMYVLDEPSIGLHQHDNNKLIKSLKELRDLGNTVIVVEHDKAMMEQADFLIDIGPGSGNHGGKLVLADTIENVYKSNSADIKDSYTAQYLKNLKMINMPKKRREGNGFTLTLNGATGNNLKNVTLDLPLGKFICVTGMSGSGKSTLITDTLYPIISNKIHHARKTPLAYESLEGLENIDKLIDINQSPIGRTPRSNPATFTGLFTMIRDFYTLLPESKIRGYKPGRFSFNVEGGRCEECLGAGMKKIEMSFLPDVYVKCEVCAGKRYNKETLQVKYKGKNISDVLEMTVEEAFGFFIDHPNIKRKIKTLMDVGLTYIKLGQQAPTLSGGEAQRVKLAAELSKRSTGKTLYMLDEPTTGLHFEDIRILLKLLSHLVDKGNTVVVIEHNLDVIKYADWIIDLGPFGGKGGGEILVSGTPEDVIHNEISLTAKYLKEEFENVKMGVKKGTKKSTKS